MFQTKSIRTRFIVLISLAFLVFGGFFISFIFNLYQRSISAIRDTNETFIITAVQKEWEQNIILLTTILSRELIQPMYSFDISAMQRLVSVVVDKEDIEYVFIQDVKGRVLVDETEKAELLGEVLTDSLTQRSLATEEVLIQRLSDSLDITSPIRIGKDKLGILRIGYTTKRIRNTINQTMSKLKEDIDQAIAKTLINAFLIVFVTIIATIGIILFLVRGLTLPIKELVLGTENIAKGDLAHRVKITSKDEIGQLASSFNKMAHDLAIAAELTVAKEYVDNILASMIDTLIVVNPDATIRTVNQAALDLLGYEEKELIGQKIGTLIAEEALTFFKEKEIEELVKKGFVRNQELTYLTKDHRKKSMLFSGSAMLDEQGKTQGIVCSAQDISERKRAEEELKQVKDYLETVLMNLPVGLAIFEGPEFRYLRINQTLADLNGLPVEAHLGKYLLEVVPHAKEKIIPKLRKVMETGEPIVRREFSIELPKSPNPVHLLDWHFPIKGEGKKIESIVSIFVDVTELKDTQKQLLQSQKMEALGTLAGGIAHEFNNQLGIISANAKMYMMEFPEDIRGGEYIESIIKSQERAANLVRQILTFSRMDITKFTSINLTFQVSDALKMVRVTLPSNIEIRQNLQAKSSLIMGDSTMIHQVMLNLCANAHYAMEETGGIIEVTIKEVDESDLSESPPSLKTEGGRCLRLTVKDTGCGISPTDQKQVFDPFFTTKDVGKGTGLGLSVVHGIIENHNGTIKIESEVGKGTTISIFFPVTEEKKVDQNVELGSVKHSSVRNSSKRILIIDDEPEFLRLYQKFLEEKNYTVTVCEDGYKALELFKNNPNQFDLVFTDQSMPKMTGKQLTPKLLEIRPDLPIVLSSGYSDVISEKEALAMGIRKYLLKPLDLNTLQQAIEECLQTRKMI